MTSALLTQVAVEVLRSPDPDPLLSQVAVEVLRTDPKPALLSQVAVEVLSLNVPEDFTQPIVGEIPAIITGTAALSLGTALSGAIPGSVTGAANLDNGATLIAIGRIEATPRARLAGAPAPSANTGNFFLLF